MVTYTKPQQRDLIWTSLNFTSTYIFISFRQSICKLPTYRQVYICVQYFSLKEI